MNSLRLVIPKLATNFQAFSQLPKRWSSNLLEHRKYQSELFDLEKKRQKDEVGRIEKIEVQYFGFPEDTLLVMNANLSTPHDCARHLTDVQVKRSCVALVDGVVPWDMHKPLEESCTLQLLNFSGKDPYIANRTFWRSCSFMLGAVLSNIFSDSVKVQLHSFPPPDLKSGSFLYDISLDTQDWKPQKRELRAISAEMVKLARRDLPFERLEVSHDLAFEMFKDMEFKRQQLPAISKNGSVCVYRIGDHIDISRGPMMSTTNLLGRCTIGSVFKTADINEKESFYRVQGVALPAEIILNHYAFGLLENRIQKMNKAPLPNETRDENVYGKEKLA